MRSAARRYDPRSRSSIWIQSFLRQQGAEHSVCALFVRVLRQVARKELLKNMSSGRGHSHESFGTGQRQSGEGDGGSLCGSNCGSRGNWSIVIDCFFMLSETIILLPYEFTLAAEPSLLCVYGVYGVYFETSAFVRKICFSALRRAEHELPLTRTRTTSLWRRMEEDALGKCPELQRPVHRPAEFQPQALTPGKAPLLPPRPPHWTLK